MNPDDTEFECPDECHGRVEGCWVIPDVYTVLRGYRLYPDSHLGHSIMYVVVFMAAQSSKDGSQEVLPKTLMRVGIPKKGSSKASPHSISVQFSWR